MSRPLHTSGEMHAKLSAIVICLNVVVVAGVNRKDTGYGGLEGEEKGDGVDFHSEYFASIIL